MTDVVIKATWDAPSQSVTIVAKPQGHELHAAGRYRDVEALECWAVAVRPYLELMVNEAFYEEESMRDLRAALAQVADQINAEMGSRIVIA